MNLAELRRNNCHKPCESGCSQNCARMVSFALGEPLKTLRASLRIAIGIRNRPRISAPATAAG